MERERKGVEKEVNIDVTFAQYYYRRKVLVVATL